MKKQKIAIFIVLIMIILFSIIMYWICQNPNQYDTEKELTEIKSHYKFNLDSIPRSLTAVEASERGYFVYDSVQNKIYNKDVLDRFVKNTEISAENRVADEIIIVIYTIDGEPIIYDLGYKYKENIGYVLAKDATRADGSETEFTYIPKEYYEVVINYDIPSEHYGITITEDYGISAGIITLESYSDEYKDIEIARYILNLEVVDSKIDPDEVSTIDIYKTSMLKGEEEKTITLNQEETYDIIETINNLDFKEETCDGICKYYINLNSKEKEFYKSYGIEVYSNRYHITLTPNGEAIVPKEQSRKLSKILEKYF